MCSVLAAVMLPVAQRTKRFANTAPTPEVIELVVDLGELSRYLVEHTRRVMSGEPAHEWTDVADALAAAAKACRRLAVFDVDDVGDSGGR